PRFHWRESCMEGRGKGRPTGLLRHTQQPLGGIAMKVSVLKKVLALALAVVTAGGMGCSSEAGSAEPSPSSGGEEQGGSATMELRIGRTTQINKVNFTLTGPNGFSRTGSIDVKNDREAQGSIPNVPVGMPYTLSVNASSTDGNVTCTGSKSGINVTCPG